VALAGLADAVGAGAFAAVLVAFTMALTVALAFPNWTAITASDSPAAFSLKILAWSVGLGAMACSCSK